MKNGDKIRELLHQKIRAAKTAAKKAEYTIPLEARYSIRMSIKEVKQILALLPCKTCGGTNQIPEKAKGCNCVYCKAGLDDCQVKASCPNCSGG